MSAVARLRVGALALAVVVMAGTATSEAAFLSENLAAVAPTGLVASGSGAAADRMGALCPPDVTAEGCQQRARAARARSREAAPGFAVPGDGLFSALLALNLVSLLLSHAGPKPLVPVASGLLAVAGGLVVAGLGLGLAAASLAAVVSMLVMLSVPLFGWVVYLAAYGSFPTGLAAALVGAALTGKVSSLGLVALSRPGYLRIVGTVLTFLLSLAAGAAVSLVHGLAPGLLVSLVDAVAGVVFGVVAAVAALLLAVLPGLLQLGMGALGLLAAPRAPSLASTRTR